MPEGIRYQKWYGCSCGEPHAAFPPDEDHPIVTTSETEAHENARGTVIKTTHECEKCGQPVAAYWYRHRAFFED